MTQDEIIEMYLQVSKELCNDTEWCWAGVGEPLQMFAKLVAAKAIAELESQEPVAYINVEKRILEWAKLTSWETPTVVNLPKIPLYTQPPQRTWVGLTDEDKKQMAKEANYHWEMTASEYAERIGQLTEAKLKEKNSA